MHQSALCPESIQPARQLQGTLRTDSAGIEFTVIADDRDDLCGPLGRPEAKRTTGGPIHAKQPLHHWILAVALCCDIRLGDAARFSLDQRIAPVRRSISKLSSRSPIVASASPGPRSVCRPFGPLNAALVAPSFRAAASSGKSASGVKPNSSLMNLMTELCSL